VDERPDVADIGGVMKTTQLLDAEWLADQLDSATLLAAGLRLAIARKDEYAVLDYSHEARVALRLVCGYCDQPLDEPGDYCSRTCYEFDGGAL